MAHGRLSLCPYLAFHRYVRIPRFYSRSPHHGHHSRVAQLYGDADWLEKTSGVSFRINRGPEEGTMANLKSHSEANLEVLGGLFIRYALVVVLLWIGSLKFTA